VPDVEDLRLAIYRSFASTGRAPTPAELAAQGWDERATASGLAELAAARHVVLGANGEIVMAHPFATVPLGFSVMGECTLWWGGCAWDSFAIPHLLPEPTPHLVATRCPACGTAHAWSVGNDAPPSGDQVAHFLVPVAHMWDDVVHTCGNQRIFCSEHCVDAWLATSGNQRGFVMDLATLWRLAQGWYAGRLERGYVRREPVAAADYLRSVGLVGPFWGT
jgi:hypothetical protein